MEAGIGILLVVIILIVAGIAGIIFAGGLGVLSGRRRKLGSDDAVTGDANEAPGERPTHTAAANDEQDVVFHGADSES
jgi:hypothetical protein